MSCLIVYRSVDTLHIIGCSGLSRGVNIYIGATFFYLDLTQVISRPSI